MLTIEQLHVALLEIEPDRIERTTSVTKFDKFCEAICAFAHEIVWLHQPIWLWHTADTKTIAGKRQSTGGVLL
jgi:ATP-dependent DNA helicase RecG